MRPLTSIVITAIAALSLPAMAQQSSTTHKATTRELNAEMLKMIEAQKNQAIGAEDQYELDLAAYAAWVLERDATVDINNAQYKARQRAYADAMRQWRMQKAQCDRGVMSACNKPTPKPSDY